MSLPLVLKSNRAKKLYIGLALLILLFVVCNDVLMPWYVNRRGEIEVPDLLGMNVERALALLDSLGLEGRKADTRMDRSYPLGAVISQNPSGRRRVNRGRRVYLVVSGGEQLVTVPSLRGRTLREAKFQLEREGLKLGAIGYEPSDDYPENTIIEQHTASGSKVRRGTYVSILISQGKVAEKVAVPSVLGKSLKAAEQILAMAGLKVGNVTYEPLPDMLPNTVVDQFPREGEMVLHGQAVDLFIVQGGERQRDQDEN